MESAKLFLFFSFPLSIRSWSCHSRWWGTGYENASKPLVIMQAKDASKTKKKIRALERELLNQDRAKRKAEGFATQSWKMRSEQKKRLERKKQQLLHRNRNICCTWWHNDTIKKKKPSSILICVISPRGKQPVWWSYFSLEEEKPWNLEKLSVKQCYSTDLTGIAILGDPGISVHWQEDLQQCKTW